MWELTWMSVLGALVLGLFFGFGFSIGSRIASKIV